MKIKNKFTISAGTQVELIGDNTSLNPEELFVEEIIISSFSPNKSESYYSIFQNIPFIEVEDEDTPDAPPIYVAEIDIVDSDRNFKILCTFTKPNIIQVMNLNEDVDRFVQVVIKEYYDETASVQEEVPITTEPVPEETPIIEQEVVRQTYTTQTSDIAE